MSGQLFLSKETFVRCEIDASACDFGLLYAESPFGNTDRWARLDGDGKSVQERPLSACIFFFSVWCEITVLHERYASNPITDLDRP
jgi:hypothetical protein